jgi:hypothetical protein
MENALTEMLSLSEVKVVLESVVSTLLMVEIDARAVYRSTMGDAVDDGLERGEAGGVVWLYRSTMGDSHKDDLEGETPGVDLPSSPSGMMSSRYCSRSNDTSRWWNGMATSAGDGVRDMGMITRGRPKAYRS